MFEVVWNQPGYLPDNMGTEPDVFEDLQDVLEFIYTDSETTDAVEYPTWDVLQAWASDTSRTDCMTVTATHVTGPRYVYTISHYSEEE